MRKAFIVATAPTTSGRRKGQYGLQAMCEGGCVANAAIIEAF